MICSDFTVPKGYRFHPSDEELLSDLEQKNQCNDSQITTIIPEIEVCNYEPRQLPELAFNRAENLGRKFFLLFFFWLIREETWHSQRKWYFFTPRDYKYINSSRSNRTTGEGYWKITGKDRAIKASGSKAVIGRKRTLTFYKRGGPKPQKTSWVIHEYYLIHEHCDRPKQIGEYVVCCLKYKSDDSEHDKDAPFCNRGSMASNVDNQAEENLVSQELVNAVRSPDKMEAEPVGGMITEEEERLALKELKDALDVPIGNLHESKGTEQNYHPTSVESQPDRSNSSDMIGELLDDLDNLDSLFNPPAPPQLHPPHHSPMNATNVHQECRKRAYPFEHDHPTLPKKNNVSTTDDDKQVSNSTTKFENQAAIVIPEGHSHLGENLGSDSGTFLPTDPGYTQPSINGGPREFSNDDNFIELDDLLSFCKGTDSPLAEFSDTIIDGGTRVTSNRNSSVEYGSENDYSALAFGASLPP